MHRFRTIILVNVFVTFCTAESGVQPNVWAYNALIKAHCQAKQLKGALGVRSTIWSNMELVPL